MNKFEKILDNLENYVEVFVGSLFALFGFSLIPFSEITKDTFPGLMLGASFLLVGVFYIFKANHNYKKRKKQREEEL